jgi:hypothetical protein
MHCGRLRRPNTSLEEEEGRFHFARTLGDHLTRSAETRARAKGLKDVVGRTVGGKAADQILKVARSEDVENDFHGEPRSHRCAGSLPRKRIAQGRQSGGLHLRHRQMTE